MRRLSVIDRIQIVRVSSRSHPELQAEGVGMPLAHVVEAAGAELPSPADVGALTPALIAGHALAECPQCTRCKNNKEVNKKNMIFKINTIYSFMITEYVWQDIISLKY